MRLAFAVVHRILLDQWRTIVIFLLVTTRTLLAVVDPVARSVILTPRTPGAKNQFGEASEEAPSPRGVEREIPHEGLSFG
jgi:hypothetical protein